MFKTRNISGRKVGLWVLLWTSTFSTEELNFTAVFQGKSFITAALIGLLEIIGSQSQEKFETRQAHQIDLRLYKFIYNNYCTPITRVHSIYSYMFRLTFSVIIRESSSIDLRSMQLVIEW
jgi:hypothetical protein